MRQATNNVNPIFLNGSEKPAGVSLGFGYCAEHECGTRRMSKALNIGHAGKVGIEQFLASAVQEDSPHLALFERKKPTKTLCAETRLVFHCDAHTTQKLVSRGAERNLFCPVLLGDKENSISSSWNDRGFCLRATGENNRQILRDLHEGFLRGDVLLSFGSTDNPFAKSALCLTLLSSVPQEVRDEFTKSEQEKSNGTEIK